jgi:hypothetical protein
MSVIYINPYSFAATDPNFADVSLLLHGDGTNGSTTITDNSPSPKTVTAFNSAAISTDQSRFGGSSLFFPGGSITGTSHRLESASNANFQFGSGDFTIELWLNATVQDFNCGIQLMEPLDPSDSVKGPCQYPL